MELTFKWMKYSPYNLPPQGLKILCWTRGDMFVAQMFKLEQKDFWIPIPFCDSIFAPDHITPPEYWMYVGFPEERFKGLMKVQKDEMMLTMDEFQTSFPDEHQEFVRMILAQVGKRGKRIKR